MFRFILTIVLISIASSLYADQIEQLQKERFCVENLKSELTQIEKLFSIWLINSESKFFVFSNFKELTAMHTKYFDEVKSFALKHYDAPNTFDELRERLYELNKEYNTMMSDTLGKINNAENVFLIALDTIESHLGKSKAGLNDILNQCPQEYHVMSSDLFGQIDIWLDRLANMRIYTALSREKRGKLLFYVFKTKEQHLVNLHAEKKAQTLAELNLELQRRGPLAARINQEVILWCNNVKFGTGAMGRARGKLDYYFLFEESLQTMRRDLIEGTELYEKIEKLHENEKFRIKMRLDLCVNELTWSIKDTEKGGWQALFDLQKEEVQLYHEESGQFSKECNKLVDEFRVNQEKVKTIEDYREISKQFRLTRDICDNEG